MTPNPYLFIAIFIGVALVFPLIPLALAWLWRRVFQPPKPGPEKNAIYECGVESLGEAQIQFRSQYYLYAIIFLIFDVEAIFLVPFAVAFTSLPVGAFIAILVFLLLLIEGLVWRRSFPAVAASGRPDDCRRHGDQENGATDRTSLQSNGRSEIRDCNGCVRDFRRPF